MIPTPDAGVNVWSAVHVGAIACDSAGAASERMKVDALPFTVVNPMLLPGFAGPAPAGVPHTPSPRQKVVELAAVPLFRFVVGRFPVTPPLALEARLMGTTSALTIARNVGAAALPVVGPANIVLAVCVASVPVNVPVPVTGEPLTVMKLGSASPTDETPPGGVAHVASPRQNVVELAAVPPFKFVTGRLPVTPPAPEVARLIAGRSAPTIARRAKAPVVPLGVARKSLAGSPVV